MNGRWAEWALTHPQYSEVADLRAPFKSRPVDALLARAPQPVTKVLVVPSPLRFFLTARGQPLRVD
jgi:hypothetical protein